MRHGAPRNSGSEDEDGDQGEPRNRGAEDATVARPGTDEAAPVEKGKVDEDVASSDESAVLDASQAGRKAPPRQASTFSMGPNSDLR